MNVIKRDGRKESFQTEKIRLAILASTNNRYEIPNDDIMMIIDEIKLGFRKKDEVTVEELHNTVISKLKEHQHGVLAENYKTYREDRDTTRQMKTDLMKTVKAIGIETDRDNANVGNNFSSKLLRIASETNKVNILAQMPKDISRPHEVGDAYHHDLDSFNLATNCLHIPTRKMLLSGFNTGYGTINKPKRIETAAELICILMQSSQNDCFGGQSIPDFESALAEFIEPTRQEEIKNVYHIINTMGIQPLESTVKSLAEEKLVKRVHQAMQGIVYNLNTMHSRAGSQVPFSSLNLGLPKNEDEALICQALLEEYEKGMGKGEQPVFPNIIFRVKAGVNREPNDPYHYLFRLACRVAAKRMNPTFMNIDADFNKEYYDKGYIPATMG